MKNKGFRLERKTITLAFSDGAWKGAEIVCVGKVPAAVVLEFMAFADRDTASNDLSPEEQIAVTGLLRRFGDDLLIGWDMVDDAGEPIPATADGFLGCLDFAECFYVIQTWMEGIKAAAKAPLGSPDSGLSIVSRKGGGSSRARSSRRTAG